MIDPTIMPADPEEFADLEFLASMIVPTEQKAMNQWRHKVNATLKRYGARLAQQEMRIRALEDRNTQKP